MRIAKEDLQSTLPTAVQCDVYNDTSSEEDPFAYAEATEEHQKGIVLPKGNYLQLAINSSYTHYRSHSEASSFLHISEGAGAISNKKQHTSTPVLNFASH